MAKFVLTIEDGEDGEVKVKGSFDPALTRDSTLTSAQATGLEIMQAFAGDRLDGVKDAMGLEDPEDFE